MPPYVAIMSTKAEPMDKVVVITGASAGIGAELAKQLGARGARVVLSARRKEELDKVAAAIGEHALVVVADVTKRGDVEELCKAALSRFGRIDVWVNNAGRGISRAVADLTDDDMDSMWRDNVKSVLYGVQAVLPHMKSRNAGQIVNVSSGLSRAPLAPARAAYGAVKSAVNMLSAALRVELRATHPGIHVTVLLPGVVATDFGKNAVGGGVDNRNLPGAQPVEAAANAIVDVIDNPRPEAYTSSFIADVVARYQREPDAVEAEIASRHATWYASPIVKPSLPITLVAPTVECRDSFLRALREFRQEALPWWVGGDLDTVESDFAAFVARKLADATRRTETLVPVTHLWAIAAEGFVGRISIRHELSDALRIMGGHIGYDTVPSMRGRGIATEMLRQALPVARTLGLTSALLTCDDDNPASIRVIERNGGVLRETKPLGPGGSVKRYYWITLAHHELRASDRRG